MKEAVAMYRKKADKAKVSNMWAIIPVAGWVYLGVQKNNRKKFKRLLEGKQEEVEIAEEGIMNVQKVLIQVEDNLVPALESYLEAVSSLQAIFEQFHMECKGLKDNLQKTDDKMGQQVAEK